MKFEKLNLEEYTESEFIKQLNDMLKFDNMDDGTPYFFNEFVNHFVQITGHPQGRDLLVRAASDEDRTHKSMIGEIKTWRAKMELSCFKTS